MINSTKKDLQREDILRNLHPDYKKCPQCKKRKHVDQIMKGDGGICNNCSHSLILKWSNYLSGENLRTKLQKKLVTATGKQRKKIQRRLERLPKAPKRPK